MEVELTRAEGALAAAEGARGTQLVAAGAHLRTEAAARNGGGAGGGGARGAGGTGALGAAARAGGAHRSRAGRGAGSGARRSGSSGARWPRLQRGRRRAPAAGGTGPR